MRIAICSDEPTRFTTWSAAWVEARGHSVVAFGSVKTGKEAPWAEVAEEAARGECDEGIFFCWSGTGILLPVARAWRHDDLSIEQLDSLIGFGQREKLGLTHERMNGSCS